MQKSIRIQFDDYDKLKELSKQAGVPLSKYVGMLLDPSEDKTSRL
jgi:predicted DNA-binding protein